jgi:hypothetical protein
MYVLSQEDTMTNSTNPTIVNANMIIEKLVAVDATNHLVQYNIDCNNQLHVFGPYLKGSYNAVNLAHNSNFKRVDDMLDWLEYLQTTSDIEFYSNIVYGNSEHFAYMYHNDNVDLKRILIQVIEEFDAMNLSNDVDHYEDFDSLQLSIDNDDMEHEAAVRALCSTMNNSDYYDYYNSLTEMAADLINLMGLLERDIDWAINPSTMHYRYNPFANDVIPF